MPIHSSTLSSLRIVIPCLNEREAIPQVLRETMEVRQNLLLRRLYSEVKVTVVDDGSEDGSQEIVKKTPGVQLVHNIEGAGYGAALKEGISNSVENWVAFYDMDRTYVPSDLLRMASLAQESGCLGVVGNRLTKSRGMPGVHRVGNLFFKELVELLFWSEALDPCSGFWLADTATVKKLLPYLPDDLNFTLQMTMKFIKKKIPFKYVPVDYRQHPGDSKLSLLGDGTLFLRTILSQRFSQ